MCFALFKTPIKFDDVSILQRGTMSVICIKVIYYRRANLSAELVSGSVETNNQISSLTGMVLALVISIEGGHSEGPLGTGTVRKGGTISVGRGTTRKGSGAAVEAVSVVAEGFFTPPAGAPPVPKIGSPPKAAVQAEKPGGQGEEERVLTFEERRKKFEGGT